MQSLVQRFPSPPDLAPLCAELDAAGFPVSQLLALEREHVAVSSSLESVAGPCLRAWIDGLDEPAGLVLPRDEAFRRLQARREHLQRSLLSVLDAVGGVC